MPQDPNQSLPTRQQDLPEVLRRAEIFGRLTAEQLDAVVRRTRLVHLAAGEALFHQGDRPLALYLLVQGQLKLYRTSAEGNEVIIELLDAGMTFAETRLFLENPRFHVSCAALTDAEVAAIDLPTMRAVLHDSVETCLLLLRRISERAERHVVDIDRLALQSATCRLASYLLGQLPPNRNEVALKVPRGVLATRLGIRAETLSRALKALTSEGMISVDRGKILRVPNRQRLQRFIEEAGKG